MFYRMTLDRDYPHHRRFTAVFPAAGHRTIKKRVHGQFAEKWFQGIIPIAEYKKVNPVIELFSVFAVLFFRHHNDVYFFAVLVLNKVR